MGAKVSKSEPDCTDRNETSQRVFVCERCYHKRNSYPSSCKICQKLDLNVCFYPFSEPIVSGDLYRDNLYFRDSLESLYSKVRCCGIIKHTEDKCVSFPEQDVAPHITGEDAITPDFTTSFNVAPSPKSKGDGPSVDMPISSSKLTGPAFMKKKDAYTCMSEQDPNESMSINIGYLDSDSDMATDSITIHIAPGSNVPSFCTNTYTDLSQTSHLDTICDTNSSHLQQNPVSVSDFKDAKNFYILRAETGDTVHLTLQQQEFDSSSNSVDNLAILKKMSQRSIGTGDLLPGMINSCKSFDSNIDASTNDNDSLNTIINTRKNCTYVEANSAMVQQNEAATSFNKVLVGEFTEDISPVENSEHYEVQERTSEENQREPSPTENSFSEEFPLRKECFKNNSSGDEDGLANNLPLHLEGVFPDTGSAFFINQRNKIFSRQKTDSPMISSLSNRSHTSVRETNDIKLKNVIKMVEDMIEELLPYFSIEIMQEFKNIGNPQLFSCLSIIMRDLKFAKCLTQLLKKSNLCYSISAEDPCIRELHATISKIRGGLGEVIKDRILLSARTRAKIDQVASYNFNVDIFDCLKPLATDFSVTRSRSVPSTINSKS